VTPFHCIKLSMVDSVLTFLEATQKSRGEVGRGSPQWSSSVGWFSVCWLVFWNFGLVLFEFVASG